MVPREALVLRKLNGVPVFRDALTFTNRDAIARSACACCFQMRAVISLQAPNSAIAAMM